MLVRWNDIAQAVSGRPNLYVAVQVSANHHFETFDVNWSLNPNTNPGQVAWVDATGVTLRYQSQSSDSSEDTLHLGSVNLGLSYGLDGRIEATDDTHITATAHAVAGYQASTGGIGGRFLSWPNGGGAVFDQTWRAVYQIVPGQGQGVTLAPPAQIASGPTVQAPEGLEQLAQMSNFAVQAIVGDLGAAIQAAVAN